MNTADRRTEIINILIIRRRTTARELADEFGVTTRTIQKDIQALSPGYPIYTKQGGDGGIFLGEDYKPYVNTLSADEQKTLREIYGQEDGSQKKTPLQIIQKDCPDKQETRVGEVRLLLSVIVPEIEPFFLEGAVFRVNRVVLNFAVKAGLAL